MRYVTVWMVAVILILGGNCLAQYDVLMGKNGLILQSKKKEQSFTIEIRGKKEVSPVGAGQSAHPYFLSDGRVLQVFGLPIDEFKGNERASDEVVLKQHLAYEAGHYKIPEASTHPKPLKLATGKTALMWSFTPAPTAKEQVFLTFREKSYVVVIGSAVVDAHHTKADLQELLKQTANSFRAYDHPVTLKFNPDGSYAPK